MSLVKAATFPLSEDLSEINRRLSQARIPYRIVEEQGKQVVWVADCRFVEQVKAIIDDPQMASMQDSIVPELEGRATTQWRNMLILYPLSLIIIVLGFVGFFLIQYLPNTRLTQSLFFIPWPAEVAGGAYWRILTPAFLHFGFFHFLFNGLWIWEMGRRIELWLGKFGFFILFLWLAIGANYVQFLSTGMANFGGLSGVVYGFVGFLLVSHYLTRHKLLAIAPGIHIFMLLWLAFGFLGFIDLFIQGSVANGAHLGGLVLGLIAGLFSGFLRRKVV